MVRSAVRFGFWLAVIYCGLGISLELLHDLLPRPVYERIAGLLYGLPASVVRGTSLSERLNEAIADGRVPSALGAALYPAVGVLFILAVTLAIGLLLRSLAALRSLKHR